MTFEQTRRILKLRLSDQQVKACRFLEAQGFRFCVDYGYRNAVEKMAQFDPIADKGIAELERMMEL